MTRRCRGYVGTTYTQVPHEVPNDEAHFGPHKSQCRVCYRAYAVDWRARRAGDGRRPVSLRSVGRLAPVLDGVKQLSDLIAQTEYRTIVAAVAAHTVFLHPDTVAQTGGAALFPMVRDMARRGVFGTLANGRRVMFDDNNGPGNAFLWSACLRRGEDVQFNHVWNCAGDPDAYTALWNLCATPAFLAKTTDGSNHPEVTAALRYHAFDLYGHWPAGFLEPEKPAGYDDLKWATHPPTVSDLEETLRQKLRSSAKSRTAIACREIGWLFRDGRPDASI